MDDTSRSSPISFAGVLAAGDEGTFAVDQGSQIGSAAGSLQAGEGILSGGGDGGNNSDAEFGFQRFEVGKDSLVGTVQFYERHIFLCYKTPHVWPSHIDAAEFDRLPRLLSAAISARKGDMNKLTRLTICEGEDGTESSNGDVLIFPDMIRYRRLTHFDVDNFVEEVLVKNNQWLPGTVETLTGTFVFVCSHGNRDRRCGTCGPVLVRKFKEELNLREHLHDQVSVSPCSHIGGHKYAGNVIVFSSSINGGVTGHWYGYVTPDDVPLLLDQHICKGEIVDHLWRGQMGLKDEDQRKAQELRVQKNGETDQNPDLPKQLNEADDISAQPATFCQGIIDSSSSCCQNGAFNEKLENDDCTNLKEQQTLNLLLPRQKSKESKPGCCARKTGSMSSWFKSWEHEDTYAALAVIAAVASIAVAYSCYRQLR